MRNSVRANQYGVHFHLPDMYMCLHACAQCPRSHGSLLEALRGSSGNQSVDTVLIRKELSKESEQRQQAIMKLKETLEAEVW